MTGAGAVDDFVNLPLAEAELDRQRAVVGANELDPDVPVPGAPLQKFPLGDVQRLAAAQQRQLCKGIYSDGLHDISVFLRNIVLVDALGGGHASVCHLGCQVPLCSVDREGVQRGRTHVSLVRPPGHTPAVPSTGGAVSPCKILLHTGPYPGILHFSCASPRKKSQKFSVLGGERLKMAS